MRSSAARWARDGALPGTAVFVAAYGLLLARNLGFSVMGHSDGRITDYVMSQHLWTLVGTLTALLAVHVVVGALVGLTTMLVARTLAGWPARRGWLLGGGVTALVYLLVWAWHVKTYPQLHVETLYQAGGAAAALQRFVTHRLPAGVFVGLGWAALALLGATALRLGWRHRRPAAAILGVTAGWVLVGRAPEGENGGTPRRPNVLLIADDSLRPDRLGAYGYDRPTSPAIDAFAEQAVVFEHAYVPLARTFPSWASILTGRWPHEHGIRHMFPPPGRRLGDQPTLPRLFAAHGYRTAVVADYAGDIFTRMEAGFETVRAPSFTFGSLVRQRCFQMLPAIVPWIDHPLGRALFPDLVGLVELPRTASTVDALIDEIDRGDGRPFFIVAFVSSSHFPYAAPDPYYRRFVDPAYRGRDLYLRFKAPTEHDLGDLDHLSDLFDGTVRYFDDEFGRLLAALDARGLADSTVVVLTADHGEMLGEHGTTGHGDHLRGHEALQVPLIIRGPGLRPHRVPGLVRTVDLARTLAALAGLPASDFGGVDLGPLLRGERDTLGLTGFGETGVWFAAEGHEFFYEDRIPYPDLTALAEVRADHDHEICMRPGYEDLVDVAKHRAAWTPDRKVIYVPTPDGVRLEAWRTVVDPATGARREIRDEHPDPALVEALWTFLRAGGRNAIVGGYALPRHPVAPP